MQMPPESVSALPCLSFYIIRYLYYIIRYYSILYYIILYYTMLYYIILYYTILYCIILYYTILYYILLYLTIFYYIMLYYIILYYTILYYIILYYTILYYIVLYYIVLYLLMQDQRSGGKTFMFIRVMSQPNTQSKQGYCDSSNINYNKHETSVVPGIFSSLSPASMESTRSFSKKARKRFTTLSSLSVPRPNA